MGNFELMNLKELEENNGGLLAGALAGAILGGTAGLICATGYGISKGELSGGTLYRAYVAGALSGAACGTVTPL